MKFSAKLSLLAVFLCTLAYDGFCSSDTTYSDTRLVKRSSDNEKNNQSQSRYNNDDEEEDCFSSCFTDIAADCLGSLFQEVAAAIGSPDIVSMNYATWGFGFSFLNFTNYPSASLNYAVKISTGPHFPISRSLHLRVYGSGSFSCASSIYSDYERDILVDGIKVGVQKDSGNSYSNHSLTLMPELLFRPGGEFGHFFVTVGAGPRIVYENMKGIRRNSNTGKTEDLTVAGWSAIPCIAFGAGRLFATSEESFGTMEFKVLLGFNSPEHQKSLPGDNTTYVYDVSIFEFTFGF